MRKKGRHQFYKNVWYTNIKKCIFKWYCAWLRVIVIFFYLLLWIRIVVESGSGFLSKIREKFIIINILLTCSCYNENYCSAILFYELLLILHKWEIPTHTHELCYFLYLSASGFFFKIECLVSFFISFYFFSRSFFLYFYHHI